MSNEEAALSIQGLTAGYGGPPIIDKVSLTARRGAITAIVGPNGAGKSTLLKAVAGLIRTTAGRVFVEGKEVTGQPVETLVRRGIAYVPQVENVFPDLTVRENLDMGGYVRKSGVRERIEQLFDLFPDLRVSVHPTFAALTNFQHGLIAALVLLILGASFFWFMMHRRVISPLTRLAKAVMMIQLDQPIEVMHTDLLDKDRARRDEIGDLVAAFSAMEREIRSHYKKVMKRFKRNSTPWTLSCVAWMREFSWKVEMERLSMPITSSAGRLAFHNKS